MAFCNLMTSIGCNGFGNFFLIWVGLAILVLLGALAKKWLGEEESLNIPYNWIGSLLGVIVYIIAGALTASGKIALIVGIIGMLFGGFGSGPFLGGSE